MRKCLLLVALTSLLLAPPALAGDGHEREAEQAESHCPVPDVDLRYDTETFTTLVSLPVDHCRSREDREFILSVSIARADSNVGRDMIEGSALCGPYPAAEGEADDNKARSACDLSVWLDHPKAETAQYDVEVTYPGATAERTMRLSTFCTSDGKTATCEH